MKGIRNVLAAAGLGLALSLSLTAPVAAAPPSHDTFVFEYSGTAHEPCGAEGLEVDFTGVLVIDATIRVGPDGLDYGIEHLTIRETHTANGTTTTYTERTVTTDLKLSFDPASVRLTVVAFSTGHSTLLGPDGKVIALRAGQVRFTFVVDVATGDIVSFDVLKELTGRTDDFCAVEMPLFLG